MRRKAIVWVALFFAALTIVGLWTAPDYGLPCDEPAEQVILRENMLEYALQWFGPESGASRYYQALGIRRISESIERDHGQSAYYAAVPLLSMADTDPATMTALWHGYTWLWFMVGVFALYSLARSLGLSRPMACAASLLLYLSPRFFAEGHYNNKDVVLLALILWTLAAGARMLREPTLPRALLFSLAGAMATNTKIVGAFAWGLMGLATLWTLFSNRTWTRSRIRIGVVAILAYAGFYALLTPALWHDPVGYAAYLLKNASGFSRWTGVVIFRGAVYDPTGGLPLPHSYLPVMIAVTLPLLTLLLAAIGQGRAVQLFIKRDARWPIVCVLTLLWAVPAAYVILRQPLQYNGWRHFYFLFAGIAPLGALGLQTVLDALKNRPVLRKTAIALVAGALALQTVGIAVNHPYQYAYYNPLAGDAEALYELDYWDVSTVNAMRELCSRAEADASAEPLLLGSRDPMSDFGVQHGYQVLTAAQKATLSITDAPDAPYLFYNTTYAEIYGVSAPEGYQPLFSLQSYGNTLCTVYRRDDGTNRQ